MTAFSTGTLLSRMSRPISRKTGPGAPAIASRKAIEHMSATRSVVTTFEENFVIGFMMSTWGRSWRDPILVLVKPPLAPNSRDVPVGAKGVGAPGILVVGPGAVVAAA